MQKLKVLLSLAALTMIAGSCSVKEDRSHCIAPVTVHVNGFYTTQEPFLDTKAQSVSDYSGLQKLTLAFYTAGGALQYKVTHTKGNMEEGETFGEFSTSLPMGIYTMVVLGYVLYDEDELTLTSPTKAEYTVNAPRETFAATETVDVNSTSALYLTATLNRIVSQLRVISTDGKTANVSKVRMSFSAGGKAFNPTTGLATANTGSVSIVGNSAAVGNTSSSTGYIFLISDEQTMDVTIETLDTDENAIFSQTVPNVPLKRNRRTILTGALYNASASATSFQVNNDWLTDYNGTF